MPAKPMLDDVELQQVQQVASRDASAVEHHGVPALDGDFLQDLGRRSVRVELTGVLTGDNAADGLKKLREKFKKTEPVPFVSDIATATVVDKVLIGELHVEEVAGIPNRFEYAVGLLEFVEAPKSKTEPPPPPPPPPPNVEQGTLEVEVIVEGQPGFDHSQTVVTADGTTDAGDTLTRTLTNRKDNVWREETIAPGTYTVKAAVMTPQVLTGTAPAKIEPGQTTKGSITVAPGAVVATEFVVHFRFDKAFVEPCMRHVLKQVVDFATANPSQKLLIVGNTDLVGTPGSPTGPDPYNQSLSERRARAVFAFLTFGRDEAGAVAEWTELRKKQTGGVKPTLADNWGTRQYQHMLQDLGFYPGGVDGKEGKLTQEAVRAFRCQSGLPPGTVMDDPAWDKLIRAYMGQDSFAIADAQFFRNCGAEPLKWTAVASQDPVKNTRQAHRPNRRVELLFVNDTKLQCDIPKPDTFDLPTPGAVGSDWCVGPGDKSKRACFVVPHLPKDGKPKGKEWTRTPAEPGTVDVQVSIKKEVVGPDGSVTLENAGNQPFVLITSDGEFKAGEQSTGEPTPAKTDSGGTKTFAGKFPGIHSIDVLTLSGNPVLVRAEDAPGALSNGNSVCAHLTTDKPALNVVMLTDPVLRQMRLPVAVHRLRALHPTTRNLRTCPVVGGQIGDEFDQATQRDEANVRRIFDQANEVWRQGRVRFDIKDIVEESYAFSIACEVTNGEIGTLLERCAYPNVVNVYFVADLDGQGEAGGATSMEDAAAAGVSGGAFVGDRFQFTLLGIPQDRVLDDAQSRQVLAHELGHFLTLPHTSDDSTNARRLMFPNTGLTGDNTLLQLAEATQARASRGGGFECVPLSLTVTGATQLGGMTSHEFLVIQDPAGIVTIDATISPELLAAGTVTMTGGDAGANNLQRTVSTATAGPGVEIVATYTPTSGDVISTRGVIQVSTFQLRVIATGARLVNPTTTLVPRAPFRRATIVADLIPAPFCFPSDGVQWTNGDAADDPLRRTLQLDNTGVTTVSATIASVKRDMTVVVFEVVLISHAHPTGPPITFVQIEGLPNHTLSAVDLSTLAGAQVDSVFQLRADIPTILGNTLQANLRLTAPDGSAQNVPLTLTRKPTGFLSIPLLAVPVSIPANAITLKPPPSLTVLRVVRGTHVVGTVPVFGGLPSNDAPVRMGRVTIFAQTFTDASTSAADLHATVADVRRQIQRANTIWNPQAGLEIVERSIQIVPDPGGLLQLADNGTAALTVDEQRLLGQIPGGPAHSATATDLNVYYVQDIQGPPSGISFKGRAPACIAIEGPSVTDSALAHEIGHWLLVAYPSPAGKDLNGVATPPGDEHIDLTGKPWPSNNVMHQTDTGGGDVDRNQLASIAGFGSPVAVVT